MPAPDRSVSTAVRRSLVTIAMLSVVLRIGAAVYLGNHVTVQPGTADQLSYHTLELRVLEGHGFSFETGWWPATPAGEPTAHWSYLYVLFLSGVYAVAGPVPLLARIVQAALVGVLQPLLTFAIARRLFGDRVGVVSAAVSAGYAYFIYYAGALMTESFFFVALLVALHAAIRITDREASDSTSPGRWLTLGIALLAAVLLRQAFLVCVPFVLLWVGWRQLAGGAGTTGSVRHRALALARGFAIALLVLIIGIFPWTLRNYRAFHQFVLLNTNAGFAFYWGNHPIHGRHFIPILPGDGSLYGQLLPDDLRGRNEAEMDRALLRRGLDFAVQDPSRYLALSFSRIREFVKFWPSIDSDRVSNVARVLSFGICLPFLLAGLVVAVREGSTGHGRPELWLVLGVATVYSLAHVLTWTLVRYRLPVDALLVPFAALALVRAADRVTRGARTVSSGVLATG